MGKSSRARRDARRRAHQRTSRVTSRPGQDDVVALIDDAARFAVSLPRAAGPHIDRLNALGAAATDRSVDPAIVVVEEVLMRIGAAWENGWQPNDLIHATRRRATGAAARWIARAVLVESARAAALERAPEQWADQLRGLAHRHDSDGGPDSLLAPRGGAATQQWIAALVALDFLHRLPAVQRLVPPPSRWGQAAPAPRSRARAGGQHAKTLTKVRALLAKAESTEFPAEAEAFTAKAQDLMTRHAIDEAMVADQAGESVDVRAVRVLIHHPYALEKAILLDVIASANRSRAVWHEFGSFATLVGAATDLDQVDLLFTSTLVQATRAMTRAGDDPSTGDSSSGFRKAFLSAYAVRIGERLAESSAEATAGYGTALVPVLQRQAEAIDHEFDQLFPNITSTSGRRSFNARGWAAGTRAADDAVLPAGAVEA